MMPKQLARGKARARPRSTPRPLIELLPRVRITDIKVPRDWNTYSAPNISFVVPQLSNAKLSCNQVTFYLRSGGVATFQLKRGRTGFGWFQHVFVCRCQRTVKILYFYRDELACRFCHRAIPATQALSKRGREALKSRRARTFLAYPLGIGLRTRARLQALCTTSKPVRSKRVVGDALLPQGRYGINTGLKLVR